MIYLLVLSFFLREETIGSSSFCFSHGEDLQILKRCSGFPIVIEVVGSSLKGQPLHIWKGQVESWSQESSTILDNPDSTVLDRLQPSFNALKSNLKECFLDMGLFLEDQKIRASVIIDIWMELYGKGNTSSHVVYMKYLDDLASQHLLKLIPLGRNEHEDGYYNELLVTQHDLLRELSIHKSELETILERKRLNLEIHEDDYPLMDHPVKARLLSISTGDSFTSSWVKMDCPNVEALLLNLSSSNYALPDFIATMKKLKVLVIINHGHDLAKLTNLSCLSSLPNLKRIRLEKVSITLLDILQLQRGSLKKLSLVMCRFGEVSHDSKEIDVSKTLLSLQEIDIDYCYDLDELPYWISEVVSLKTLSITNCNKLSKLPEAIGNLSKLEVLRLSSCINLSELPETTERLSNLQFLDISHCLGLRKLPLEIGKLQKLKKMSMRDCYRCELPDSVNNLENLTVKCDEGTVFLWERFKPKMKNLTITEEETEHNLNLLLLSCE
ncbi:probable disease resistance protein At5g66910 [Eutrema salsugineum]|uniref:probable disease resistance protein At5g66910 n=1 Tax=Eutrema salsugineum TaxID=72664 RepID=UPI000CED7B5C|nr:probable disease resistance protein At5g66910 [Eutrema salsugineum]